MTAPANDIAKVVAEQLLQIVTRTQPTERAVGYYLLSESQIVWKELVSWIEDLAIPGDALIEPQPFAEQPVDRIEIINEHQNVTASFLLLSGSGPATSDETVVEVVTRASSLLVHYLEHFARSVPGLTDPVQPDFARLIGRAHHLRDSVALPAMLVAVSDATALADDAAKTANDKIAELAAKTQSQSYKLYGTVQNRFFYGCTGAAVAIVLVVGYRALTTEVASNSSVNQSIQHIATLAIALGLAGYLAKQGAKYRANAVWSEAVSVQLDTFDAFLAPVESQETRDQMRLLFATRAFGSSPERSGTSADEITWVPQLITALVDRSKDRGS